MSDTYGATEATPDTLAIKRKLAYALGLSAADTSPVKAWSQGAARIAQGLLSGYGLASADKEQSSAREASIRDFMAALQQQSGGAAPAALGGGTLGAPAASVAPPGPAMAQVAGTEDTIPLPKRNPIGALNPEFRSKFADLRTAAGDRGAYFDAPEQGSLGNVRSPQQQLALYAQGRTAPGPVVTGTTHSNHITGRALDVVPKEGSSEKQIGSVVSALMASDPRFAGMRSGATFSNLYDPLHVELNKPQGPTQVASLDPNAGVAPPPVAQPPAGPPPVQMAQAQPQQIAPQPQQQINPALIRALSSQWLPPAMGQIAAGQINRQLTPPELKMTKDFMGEDVPNTWDPNRQLWNGKPLQAGASGGAGGQGAFNGVSPDAPPEEVLAAADKKYPGVANRVQQLWRGEGAAPNARQNKLDGPAMQLAQKLNPDWNMAVWKQKSDTMADYSTKGKSGQNMENLAKISNHMAELVQSMKELGNGSLPAANAVGNAVSRYAMGSDKVTNFNINANAVADEMASLMRREGMSDESIRQWRDNLSPNMSEEQQKGAMRKMSNLIMERMNPLASNYERVMGKKIDLWGAFPDSKKSFDSIQEWASAPTGGKPSSAGASVEKTIGGKTYVKRGEQWFEK